MPESLDIALNRLKIKASQIDGVDVLVLPENVFTSDETLFDTPESVELAKHLKKQGVACKTSFDLQVETDVLERRGLDIWLGILWILREAVAPEAMEYIRMYIRQILPRIKSSEPPIVHLKIGIKRENATAELDFKGPPDSLDSVLQALKCPTELPKLGS